MKREVFLEVVTFSIWPASLDFKRDNSKDMISEHKWDVQEYRSRKLCNVFKDVQVVELA